VPPASGYGEIAGGEIDLALVSLADRSDAKQLVADASGGDVVDGRFDIEKSGDVAAEISRVKKALARRRERDARPVLTECPDILRDVLRGVANRCRMKPEQRGLVRFAVRALKPQISEVRPCRP